MAYSSNCTVRASGAREIDRRVAQVAIYFEMQFPICNVEDEDVSSLA